MLNLHQKEASGIPLLGSFVAYLADELTKAMNKTFSADMEYHLVVDTGKSGAKPASDAAVVAITTEFIEKPIILYEYKPVVDQRSNYVDNHQIMEVPIQAYYLLYQHKVLTLIHCLTDLHQWYYLKVDKTFQAEDSMVQKYQRRSAKSKHTSDFSTS